MDVGRRVPERQNVVVSEVRRDVVVDVIAEIRAQGSGHVEVPPRNARRMSENPLWRRAVEWAQVARIDDAIAVQVLVDRNTGRVAHLVVNEKGVDRLARLQDLNVRPDATRDATRQQTRDSGTVNGQQLVPVRRSVEIHVPPEAVFSTIDEQPIERELESAILQAPDIGDDVVGERDPGSRRNIEEEVAGLLRIEVQRTGDAIFEEPIVEPDIGRGRRFPPQVGIDRAWPESGHELISELRLGSNLSVRVCEIAQVIPYRLIPV